MRLEPADGWPATILLFSLSSSTRKWLSPRKWSRCLRSLASNCLASDGSRVSLGTATTKLIEFAWLNCGSSIMEKKINKQTWRRTRQIDCSAAGQHAANGFGLFQPALFFLFAYFFHLLLGHVTLRDYNFFRSAKDPVDSLVVNPQRLSNSRAHHIRCERMMKAQSSFHIRIIFGSSFQPPLWWIYEKRR